MAKKNYLLLSSVKLTDELKSTEKISNWKNSDSDFRDLWFYLFKQGKIKNTEILIFNETEKKLKTRDFIEDDNDKYYSQKMIVYDKKELEDLRELAQDNVIFICLPFLNETIIDIYSKLTNEHNQFFVLDPGTELSVKAEEFDLELFDRLLSISKGADDSKSFQFENLREQAEKAWNHQALDKIFDENYKRFPTCPNSSNIYNCYRHIKTAKKPGLIMVKGANPFAAILKDVILTEKNFVYYNIKLVPDIIPSDYDGLIIRCDDSIEQKPFHEDIISKIKNSGYYNNRWVIFIGESYLEYFTGEDGHSKGFSLPQANDFKLFTFQLFFYYLSKQCVGERRRKNEETINCIKYFEILDEYLSNIKFHVSIKKIAEKVCKYDLCFLNDMYALIKLIEYIAKSESDGLIPLYRVKRSGRQITFEGVSVTVIYDTHGARLLHHLLNRQGHLLKTKPIYDTFMGEDQKNGDASGKVDEETGDHYEAMKKWKRDLINKLKKDKNLSEDLSKVLNEVVKLIKLNKNQEDKTVFLPILPPHLRIKAE